MPKNARTFGQDLMKGENPKFKGGRVKSTYNDSERVKEKGLKGLAQNIHSGVLRKGESGVTRGEKYNGGDCWEGSGTSIFDPVLCEIIYTWFCPKDGKVLDPFAGGSVRGIVAGMLGRKYTGVDLSKVQIEANKIQWKEIKTNFQKEEPKFIDIKISAKMAKQKFNGCEPDYIKNVCHASRCDSSKGGTLITIHPTEREKIKKHGGIIKGNLLQAGETKRCPFKNSEYLCDLHLTKDKPFGCMAPPFTLNENNTLIIRNRYRLLKCYNDGQKMPAFKAFRASLELIFGNEGAEGICNRLDESNEDFTVQMAYRNYKTIIENDQIKKGDYNEDVVGHVDPIWYCGDSAEIKELCKNKYDLIFTCPPYYDLEVYTDDPNDLSTMQNYEQFLDKYRFIIAESCGMLKDNRFACFVVGDIRDKDGFYRNFVSDTIQAFQDAGVKLYNEGILITAVGSLPIRIDKQFGKNRKLGKTHQNVLVFYRGAINEIRNDFDISILDGLDKFDEQT